MLFLIKTKPLYLQLTLPYSPILNQYGLQTDSGTGFKDVCEFTCGFNRTDNDPRKSTIPKGSTELTPLPGNALSMPISISLKGSYSSILAFIKDLEVLRIPPKFDSLAINSSQTQEGSTIVSVITARIPFLRNNEKNKTP